MSLKYNLLMLQRNDIKVAKHKNDDGTYLVQKLIHNKEYSENSYRDVCRYVNTQYYYVFVLTINKCHGILLVIILSSYTVCLTSSFLL
jgi:hypothetical protein